MAYQTNLLVMNAGNYSFADFVRVGLPLALLMWILLKLFAALAIRYVTGSVNLPDLYWIQLLWAG